MMASMPMFTAFLLRMYAPVHTKMAMAMAPAATTHGLFGHLMHSPSRR
jgi:hypothetical protein